MNIVCNVFGPSTAGKSTLTSLLENYLENAYVVDFDVIKRQKTNYYWKSDREAMKQLSLDTLIAALKTDLPIVLLLPPAINETTYKLEARLKESKYKLINIEVIAPKNVLIQRYKDRLEAVKKSDSGWTFKTVEEFTQKLEESYWKSPDTLTYDSSLMTPKEIFQSVRSAILEVPSS